MESKLPIEKVNGFDPKTHKRTPSAATVQVEPSNAYCHKKQVVSFIWAVCRSIIPQDLLGTPSNWRILRRNISKFLKLRRFEKFSLKQCMHKLKTSNFPFLSNKHSLCYFNSHDPSQLKQKIFERWIYWFFSSLVVPLVQANFYVTESEQGKQEVFHYRKSTWENLMNKSITCLEEQNYRLLTDLSVRSILKKRSFGFSRIRLRPKANGVVRPLANLRASSRIPIKQFSLKILNSGVRRKVFPDPKSVKYNHFMSVNSVLRDLHVVLKGIQLKEPEKLGSSVFDYNDVYRKLRPFSSNLKRGLRTVPGVYLVVSDVSKAFDSVDQNKLLSVMKDIILNDNYILKKSHQVVCTKKHLQVQQKFMLADQDIVTGSTRFTSSFPTHSADGILIDEVLLLTVKKVTKFFSPLFYEVNFLTLEFFFLNCLPRYSISCSHFYESNLTFIHFVQGEIFLA